MNDRNIDLEASHYEPDKEPGIVMSLALLSPLVALVLALAYFTWGLL